MLSRNMHTHAFGSPEWTRLFSPHREHVVGGGAPAYVQHHRIPRAGNLVRTRLAGDLPVQVSVAAHPTLQREGVNIFSSAPMTFAQAALGGDIRISTVDGDVLYTVKPGTQTDTRIRLRGKGVPSIHNKNVRGDHYVTLIVQTPTHLNNEAKEALKAFDAACGTEPGAGEKKKKRHGFRKA